MRAQSILNPTIMFTVNELSVMNLAIQTSLDNKSHLLTGDELKLGVKTFKKLKTGTKEENGQPQFIDSEIEFEEDEKAFLLKKLDRPWSIVDGEYVLDVISKLS